MIIDAHTHLHFEDFKNKQDEIIWRFRAIDGQKMVTVSITPDDFDWAIACAKKYSSLVKTTIWVHPCYVEKVLDLESCKNQLIQQYQDYSDMIVAIGECGTDRYRPVSDEWYDLQKKFLQMQCELAIEFWLPLMIHSRADFAWSFEIISKYPNLDTYRHCRTYWENEMNQIFSTMKWRARFGLWWAVTYKKSYEIRACVQKMPLESIFCETDAPYLTPQAVRWQLNEPSFIQYTYQFVAELLWLKVEDFCDIVEWNHREFWKI